ncbi:MAG: TIR domain-containing protein [Gammaproteobacteria bacterium]
MEYTDLTQIKKHKVFISYHHDNDECYKEELIELNEYYGEQIFDDRSVNTGGIDENLSDERIRETIRDKYLSDTTVTIVLIGEETKKRKHVDWELHSSMYDGEVNKKSGIILMGLPEIQSYSYVLPDTCDEIKAYFPNGTTWSSIDKATFREEHPYLSDKMVRNVLKDGVYIPVVEWDIFGRNPMALKHLIDVVYNGKNDCKYDLSIPMRRNNS